MDYALETAVPVTSAERVSVGFVRTSGWLGYGHRTPGVWVSRRNMTNGQARLAEIALGQAV